ncbi:MAG: hypothetical protein PHG47_08160 [Sulfuricella sp.]|nr:hypothetical protein [Sulfuricella sp.]
MTGRRSLVAIARDSRAILPFDAISSLWLGAIELGLREAWKELVKNQSRYQVDIDNDDEHLISEPLVRAINFLRNNKQKDPFLTLVKHFDHAYVGAGFRNYKNEEIQQPDLVFKPRIAPHAGIDAQYYAVFIEAKVISEKSHQKVGEYFRDGVIRFIDGRYAWAMRQGLMLAYVRGVDLDAGAAIQEYLKPSSRYKRFAVKSSAVRVAPPNPLPNVYQTTHSRDWSYDADSLGEPGDIAIRHLWLSVYI